MTSAHGEGDVAFAIDHVDKIYQRRGKPPVHAVRDLSMAIGKGEIVGLLGSSGCGKTSTLRMIAGFEAVTQGSIRLAGRPIEALKPSARHVAMAFEGYSLYPPLTVRDNIAFALKSARQSREQASARVQEIAKLLEIESFLDRYPATISGGQQQRASLARALVREADLYLLDEPMGQLEPQLRAVLRGRIKALLNANRMTAIFVTHDQTEANALADRIAVMEGGVLQQLASPADLKEQPANLFVATFIGEPPMNVFEAAVSRQGEVARFAVEGGLAIDIAMGALAPALRKALPERVTLGVRPHRISLGTGAFRARVVSNQWLGDQAHVAAEVAGRLVVAVAHQRVPARSGEEIPFSFAARDLHVFDAVSGVALAHGAGLQ
jgi:multiple sugar transport system ATP-binding protein